MIPILYDYGEKDFITNGLGCLNDATSCIVTEERNGAFELSMTYPVNGIHYNDILIDRIIYAKPSEDQEPQPFDIYKISKPINGHVTVSAAHISYRTRYVIIKPFSVKSEDLDVVQTVISKFDSEKVKEIQNPFIIRTIGYGWSEKDEEYSFDSPRSLKECIGGGENSFIGIYGGELLYDKFYINIFDRRGNDKESPEVRIAYSKNLVDLTHTEDTTKQISGIFPYYSNSDGSIALSGDIIYVDDNKFYPYDKIEAVDFRNMFDSTPTKEELEETAKKYIEDNNIGKSEINIKVSFVPLYQTEEYKNIAPLERVRLCDYVIVEFKELGVESVAQVIKTEYDVLLDRYLSITLGENDNSLDKKILSINSSTKAETIKKISQSESLLRKELSEQRDLMNGVSGGYIVTVTDPDGRPEELVIGDSPSIETMQNCIRINRSGIAFGHDGYSGEFISAWTIDGRFSADWITTGQMNGERIKAGTIESGSLIVGNPSKYDYTKVVGGIAPEWVENVYYRLVGKIYRHVVTFSASRYFDQSDIGIKDGFINVEYWSSSPIPFTNENIPEDFSNVLYSEGFDFQSIRWNGNIENSGHPYAFGIYKDNDIFHTKAFGFSHNDNYDIDRSFNFSIWGSELTDNNKDESWETPTISINYGILSTPIVPGVTKYRVFNDGHYIGYVDSNNNFSQNDAYWAFERDDVELLLDEYELLTEEPTDWGSSYINYYTRDDEKALGEYIRIGVDKKTGKPIIKLSAKDGSNIQLIETNDRLSFVNVTDPNNPIEMAYISGTAFEAPKFKLGGYSIEQTNGVVFKWNPNQ